MPRPYSMDLRARAVARVMAGETVRSVAAVLKMSVASVVKWSQRFRQTGSVPPGAMHGHRPRILLPYRDWLIARTAGDRPFTLRGLQAELAERGVRADYRTVWAFVHVVFIAETSTKTNMTPLRGWGPRGQRLDAKVPYGHWKTLTFLAALLRPDRRAVRVRRPDQRAELSGLCEPRTRADPETPRYRRSRQPRQP